MPACDATHQQSLLSKASLNFTARGGLTTYVVPLIDLAHMDHLNLK